MKRQLHLKRTPTSCTTVDLHPGLMEVFHLLLSQEKTHQGGGLSYIVSRGNLQIRRLIIRIVLRYILCGEIIIKQRKSISFEQTKINFVLNRVICTLIQVNTTRLSNSNYILLRTEEFFVQTILCTIIISSSKYNSCAHSKRHIAQD